MLIAVIIARIRCHIWQLPVRNAGRNGEKKRRYQSRYMRDVYRKSHVTRNIALSPAEDRRLCIAAKAHGRKPTTMLRKSALAHIDGEMLLPVSLQETIAALTLDVRRIGTNINQIAHQANFRPETAEAGFRRAIALLEELEGAPARYLALLSALPAHGDQIDDAA
jgi:hypothetical protein